MDKEKGNNGYISVGILFGLVGIVGTLSVALSLAMMKAVIDALERSGARIDFYKRQ